jgi:hypothetical protein
MTDEPLIRHKTHTIRLMSNRRNGQWVPHALVCRPGENEASGHPVTGDRQEPLSTREAADDVAKKLAIEWIDSQFPSAAD